MAALRIALRAIRLNVPPEEPIGKGRHNKTKRPIFITDGLVTTLLRMAAKSVYRLPEGDPELNKWSTHSIRVTAANLLHRERFSDSHIHNVHYITTHRFGHRFLPHMYLIPIAEPAMFA